MKICYRCSHRFDEAGWSCPNCGAEPPLLDSFPSFGADVAQEGPGFDEAFFDNLVQVEERSFWFEARNQLILDLVRKHAPGAHTMIDVGCGTGIVLQALRAHTTLCLTGAEPFLRGLHWARQRAPGVDLIQSDVRSLPYEEAFDVVGAFDVLEHIAEDEQALAVISRILRPSGILIATVPQHRWLWSHADVVARHFRRYTRGELRSKLVEAGFQSISMTAFVSLLLPAMVAVRYTTRRKAQAELSLPTALNAVLSNVMRLERTLIHRGIRFPFGGSLIVVARKMGA